ncbi:MAG: hypothetical protein V1792_23565 [Pseudomonadota bacterium]
MGNNLLCLGSIKCFTGAIMTLGEQTKQDWLRFLELKQQVFSGLGILKWRENLKWRDEFESEDFQALRDCVCCEILKSGLGGLNHLFLYLADMYCYAAAAEAIAREYEQQSNIKMTDFWRYRIRNYHFSDLAPRYVSLLDHAAYFVASLTKGELVKGTPLEKKGTMYYGTFRPILCESLHSSHKIGYLTQDDRKIMYDFLRSMDIEPKNPGLNKIVRNYRQDMTHLFLPGIDHITQTIEPQKKKNDPDEPNYLMRGVPKYQFKELEEFAKTVIPMIDSSFELLFKTGVMKSCLKEEPEKTSTHDE